MPVLEDQLLFYAFTDVKLFKNCGGAQPHSAALLGKKIHDSSFCNPITLTSNLSSVLSFPTEPSISLSENNFSCVLRAVEGSASVSSHVSVPLTGGGWRDSSSSASVEDKGKTLTLKTKTLNSEGKRLESFQEQHSAVVSRGV